MKILITGGTGFVGQALIQAWLSLGYEITVLGRSERKIAKIFGQRVVAWTWQTLSERQGVFDAVVHLSGYNIAKRPWTKAVKHKILSSRIDTTKALVAWCARQDHPPRLLSASAVGMYGCHHDTTLSFNEDSKIFAQSDCFSQHVVSAWEEAAQAYNTGHTVCMRLGVVMGRQGGFFAKMMWPFRLGLGAVLGTGRQPLAWVAIEDVVAAICFLLQHDDVAGVVNITAPQTLDQATFANQLSAHFNRPLWLKMPGFVLRCVLGKMADELMLSGQVVVPQTLLTHGYAFQFDDFHRWLDCH